MLRFRRSSAAKTRPRGLVAAASAAAFLAWGLVGCGSASRQGGTHTSSGAPATSVPSSQAKHPFPGVSGEPLCGTVPSVQPQKILVILEENHSEKDVIGSNDAPTFTSVAKTCAAAANYQALTHPSLPNYLAMTSGVSFARSPFNGDCDPGGSCTATAPSVFAQEQQAGKSWKSYAESMPSACADRNSGPYAVRHNPAAYYPALGSSCKTNDVPLGSTSAGALAGDVQNGSLPTLSTVTPNVDNDMHDGSVGQADSWLKQWIGVIAAGPDYRSGRLAVVVAWDEGDGDGNQSSSAPLLLLSASTRPGTVLTQPLNDYSVLHTIDQISGLPPLAGAGRAASLLP